MIIRQVIKGSSRQPAKHIVSNALQTSSHHIRWIGKNVTKSSTVNLQQNQIRFSSVVCSNQTKAPWTKSCLDVGNWPIATRSFSSAAHDSSDLRNGSVIKPWKMYMIESNGDYRDEAFLEKDDEIGGPLYRNQANLPRLPIPDLQDTIDRFLPTALPLARSPDEIQALMQACETFPTEAKVLQERLIDRAKNEMKDSSFLQLYWNQLGYLQVRDSVVVNVSYFFQFSNDPTVGTSGQANVMRAAALLYSTAEFRKDVCSGAMEPEVLGKAQTPLDATAYKYMFNACRIPRKIQDTYRIYDPSRYGHAIVARKGSFYSIDIVDKESGDLLPLSVIEEQLQQCIEMADNEPSSRVKLGILTSTNRDTWADAREELLRLGGKNMEESLEILESGAVLVNLDDTSLTDDVECSEMMLTGRRESGDNRWFDKSIQIVVDNQGQAGTLSEHSMMDGMPVVKFADYITSSTYDQVKKRSVDQAQSNQLPHKATDIFETALANMDESSLRELETKARGEFYQNIGKQSTSVVTFDGYGSNFIKKTGNPPDAFAQVALQLASYRLFGEQVGTYEATQVRPFLHGRTEVTRAVSFESGEFVKRMGATSSKAAPLEELKEKLDMLKKATAAHSNYSRLAAQAMGVDRHFFGLSMLVGASEDPPVLYNDPIFGRSKYWRVSTSNLSHPRIVNWGFGQVVPDGVGVGYSVHPNSLKFNISALDETGWTPKLAELIEDALEEMAMIASVDIDEKPSSKL